MARILLFGVYPVEDFQRVGVGGSFLGDFENFRKISISQISFEFKMVKCVLNIKIEQKRKKVGIKSNKKN